ncbi:hypothetical protein AAJ72_11085 [Citromicrobium sp. RCC1885]|nr:MULTISPECIES: hypothetical protein [unclassified Citromicrobium]KPM22438.1 hypothetical protein AAJ72_11085 [Citromicrobium sp. RCC1885]KPM25921.1 hypothetical protein AAJ74_11825 [Citromicrobium sp. RCC1878]
MLTLAQGNAPFGSLNHPRIDDSIENAIDGLVCDGAEARLGKIALRFEEAGQFGLRGEAASREAFETFLNDRSQRLITHQKLAVPFTRLGLVTPRRGKRVIAGANARFHTVAGLLGILGAGMGAHRGQQMLDQLTVAIFAKLDRGAFKNAARIRDCGAQGEMGLQPPRKARDVVDEHARRFLAVLAHKGQ